MDKICVFTGAGIGVPLGLPITTGFSDLIDKIPKELNKYISNYLDIEHYDIEKVLFLLEELVKRTDFIQHIISANPNDSSFRTVKIRLDKLISIAELQIFQIKSAFYDLLEKFDPKVAFELYRNILGEIKEVYPKCSISIFTTNYDLTFESAVYSHRAQLSDMGVKDVYYGFETELGRQLFNPNQNFEWAPDKLEYLKLHGSLDWSTDDSGICAKSGNSITPANPEVMPLLYPGYKGTPSRDPFISLHERLYTRLIEADVIIVIGFAFRDPYINNIFEFALKANKTVKGYCYEPKQLSQMPRESHLKALTLKFPNFKHVQAGVNNILNPLNFIEINKKMALKKDKKVVAKKK